MSFTEMSNPTGSWGSSQLLLGIHFATLENYKKMLSICVAGPKALGTLTVELSLRQNILWQKAKEDTEKL